MKNVLLLYGAASLFVLVGLILIWYSQKKDKLNSSSMYAYDPPARYYGKEYILWLGILSLIGGIILFNLKPK